MGDLTKPAVVTVLNGLPKSRETALKIGRLFIKFRRDGLRQSFEYKCFVLMHDELSKMWTSLFAIVGSCIKTPSFPVQINYSTGCSFKLLSFSGIN